MPRRSICLSTLLLACCTITQAEDWPQFRGPEANGHAVGKAPTTWSEDSDNLKWKVAVEGLGWSSPVVVGDTIWLTTATEEGTSLRLVSLDVATGQQQLDVEVFRLEKTGKVHSKNSQASPTAVVRNDRVYVHFGAFGTACLTTTGEIVWQRKLPYRHVHGPGGSPALYDGKLYLSCDGSDEQYVVALDAASGEIVWQTDRPDNDFKEFAFSTPTITEVNGSTQVVSAGAGGVSSYDPMSGKELWRVDYPEGYSVTPQPVVGNGMVFVSSAFDRPNLLAIDPSGSGNITETNVKWTQTRGAPHTPSPLLVGDELYLASDRGVATCFDAASGEIHWQERLGGNFSASPLLADGNIYFLNEKGAMTVVAAGKEFQEVAVNEIEGRTLATPAILRGSLFLRSDTHLYRFDAK